MNEAHSAPAVEPELPADAALAVFTTDLTKQFENHTAVSQVNLRIAAGEVYGLIGPNGAGKTTLLRMLATADEPTTGRIALFGQPLQRGGSNQDAKQRIGFLPDDFPLYDDLNVWDYLDYFARLYFLSEPRRSQRLNDVLELVQLAEKQTEIISTLSRGMRQRLSLARTVIYEPDLLLLDEPVSGLDPIARIQFRQAVKQLQQTGMTIIISSHILSDLEELCSSIGIMQQGVLVESTRLSDLYQRLRSQQILIQALEGPERLQQQLTVLDQVAQTEVLADGKTVAIAFNGTPAQSADLLRALINANLSITQFQPSQDNLENIFLKLGYRQTA